MKKREFDRLLREAVLADAQAQGSLLAAEWIADPIPQASRERFLRMFETPSRARTERFEEPEPQSPRREKARRILTSVLTACASAVVTAVLLFVVLQPFRGRSSVVPVKPADATAEPTEAPEVPEATPSAELPVSAVDPTPAPSETPEVPEILSEQTIEGVTSDELIGTWVSADGAMVREGYRSSLIFRRDGTVTWICTPRGGTAKQTDYARFTVADNIIRFWQDGTAVPFRQADANGVTGIWDVRYSADDHTIHMICNLLDQYILKLQPTVTAAPHTDAPQSTAGSISAIGGGTEHGIPQQGGTDPSDFFGQP